MLDELEKKTYDLVTSQTQDCELHELYRNFHGIVAEIRKDLNDDNMIHILDDISMKIS